MEKLNKRQEYWLKRDPLSISLTEKLLYTFMLAPLVRLFCWFSKVFLRFEVSYPNSSDKKKYKYLISLIKSKNSLLFFSNHISFWDTIFVPFSIDRLGIRHYAVVKIELFKHPIFDNIMWSLGGKPIVRSDSRGFRNIVRFIQAGRPILIFPQGTRSKKHEEIVPVQEGVASLALMQEVTFVPIKITGSDRFPLSKIKVSFGLPRKSTSVIGNNKEKKQEILEYISGEINIPTKKQIKEKQARQF